MLNLNQFQSSFVFANPGCNRRNLENPYIGEFYVIRKRWTSDFEVLKLWNVWSGCWRFTFNAYCFGAQTQKQKASIGEFI